jgi:hypothetical protein
VILRIERFRKQSLRKVASNKERVNAGEIAANEHIPLGGLEFLKCTQ